MTAIFWLLFFFTLLKICISISPPGLKVYVLPSSSGRAVFQADARLRPYAELGARLREIRKGEKEIIKMGL